MIKFHNNNKILMRYFAILWIINGKYW